MEILYHFDSCIVLLTVFSLLTILTKMGDYVPGTTTSAD